MHILVPLIRRIHPPPSITCTMMYLLFLLSLVQGTVSGADSVPVSKLEAMERQVEVALTAFADILLDSPCSPGLGNITSLSKAAAANSSVCDCLFPTIESYLEANRALYGSTVTLLGEGDGKAVCSPYVYHLSDGSAWERTDSLMDASYRIDEQQWLREAVDTQTAVWSDPYFDEGGGNIEMETYSVPLIVDGGVVGVATTDLPISSVARLAGVGVAVAVAALLAIF
jgi:hypothetical protein